MGDRDSLKDDSYSRFIGLVKREGRRADGGLQIS